METQPLLRATYRAALSTPAPSVPPLWLAISLVMDGKQASGISASLQVRTTITTRASTFSCNSTDTMRSGFATQAPRSAPRSRPMQRMYTYVKLATVGSAVALHTDCRTSWPLGTFSTETTDDMKSRVNRQRLLLKSDTRGFTQKADSMTA